MKIQRVTSHQERLWRSALEETLPEITSEYTFLSEKDFTPALEDTRCYALVATDDIPGRPVGILTAYRFPNLTAPGTWCTYTTSSLCPVTGAEAWPLR